MNLVVKWPTIESCNGTFGSHLWQDQSMLRALLAVLCLSAIMAPTPSTADEADVLSQLKLLRKEIEELRTEVRSKAKDAEKDKKPKPADETESLELWYAV